MVGLAQAEGNCGDNSANVPADIKAVFDKPAYKNATWGLRIVDLGTGKELIDLQPRCNFYIGSVRKIFSVGELLNQVGPDHRYNTPVYRHGDLNGAGVLHGDLVLVASGDLTMGGRTNPDGTIAVTDFDHNEADSLGNATLTKPNPLAGYIELAQKVAKSGVKEVTGDVIIDDRLFQPFNFRGQFDVRPIFVNGDLVDLSIRPTSPGKPASVVWRPVSAALGVENNLLTGAATCASDAQLKASSARVHRETGLHRSHRRGDSRRFCSPAYQEVSLGTGVPHHAAFELCAHSIH